jgi:hypothetical protein
MADFPGRVAVDRLQVLVGDALAACPPTIGDGLRRAASAEFSVRPRHATGEDGLLIVWIAPERLALTRCEDDVHGFVGKGEHLVDGFGTPWRVRACRRCWTLALELWARPDLTLHWLSEWLPTP